MPHKDKEARRLYINEYRKNKRKERGLKKKGRKPLTEEQEVLSKENRKIWERQWKTSYFELNVVKRLLYAAKRRSKVQGLEFNLTESDIVVPTHCPYLGIPLVSHRPRGDSRRDIASLDRIDPNKGYTKDNIEVISWLANTMKNNASPELLVAFAKEVLNRYERACV